METCDVKIKNPPLPIATVAVPGTDGLIGITSCPGLKDESYRLDPYGDSLIDDLLTIRKWGAVALVTLLDDFELNILGIKDLPNVADWLNLLWFHLPISNSSLPDDKFEELWSTDGKSLCQMLSEGQRIVIHCKEGIGRAGVIASRLLIELGTPPDKAIAEVQKARRGCLSLYAQEKYCYSLAVKHHS